MRVVFVGGVARTRVPLLHKLVILILVISSPALAHLFSAAAMNLRLSLVFCAIIFLYAHINGCPPGCVCLSRRLTCRNLKNLTLVLGGRPINEIFLENVQLKAVICSQIPSRVKFVSLRSVQPDILVCHLLECPGVRKIALIDRNVGSNCLNFAPKCKIVKNFTAVPARHESGGQGRADLHHLRVPRRRDVPIFVRDRRPGVPLLWREGPPLSFFLPPPQRRLSCYIVTYTPAAHLHSYTVTCTPALRADQSCIHSSTLT